MTRDEAMAWLREQVVLGFVDQEVVDALEEVTETPVTVEEDDDGFIRSRMEVESFPSGFVPSSPEEFEVMKQRMKRINEVNERRMEEFRRMEEVRRLWESPRIMPPHKVNEETETRTSFLARGFQEWIKQKSKSDDK